MTKTFQTLDEMINEDNAKREAIHKAEDMKEDLVWASLSQSEKDRITAEKQAKWERMAEAMDAPDPEDEEDLDEFEDEGEDRDEEYD